MNYQEFCKILTRHIFENEKKELLRALATHPERFTGLFRPTKPAAKILQFLLQSHEIRMGDALEEVIEKALISLGYKVLPKAIEDKNKEILLLDLYFVKDEVYYFIEQKVRDDHDSTKKRGQIDNFKKKLEVLCRKHSSNLVGIMYFVDPDFSKNRRYYLKELEKLENSYGVKLYLFYGKELFVYLKCEKLWDNILSWLKQWKESLPNLPELNFDVSPEESFEEIKDLDLKYWKKLLNNDKLWEEGVMKTIFREGNTLEILASFFKSQSDLAYKKLAEDLSRIIEKYYRKIQI